MNKKVEYQHFGIMEYSTCWQLQENLMQEIINIKLNNRNTENPVPTPNYLLTVVHPHVYTLGKSGKENHLLVSEDFLKKINATFFKVNRGGDITYHGFGQLVMYPILDLENFFTDIHKYVRYLEEVIIRTLKEYGIEAERSKGETGVWIDTKFPEKARKICAIGVRSSRWVTMHGLAFNLNVDINYFNYIVPCGIADKKVTSLHLELGKKVDEEDVRKKVIKNFEEVFECEVIEKVSDFIK
ncbi:MAG: octanoyltransferase [Bacteroidia bacterium]|nr:MAG: octanoyltransferase [Bacteroidia bacterium]